jgi:hypothetical protein
MLSDERFGGLYDAGMQFGPGIYQWVPERDWAQLICAELLPLVDWLKQRDIRIIAAGHWNIKAPDPILFLSSPIPHQDIVVQFARLKSGVVLKPDFIGCTEHRLSLVFEGNPVNTR